MTRYVIHFLLNRTIKVPPSTSITEAEELIDYDEAFDVPDRDIPETAPSSVTEPQSPKRGRPDVGEYDTGDEDARGTSPRAIRLVC
jgi:hypothetical protein